MRDYNTIQFRSPRERDTASTSKALTAAKDNPPLAIVSPMSPPLVATPEEEKKQEHQEEENNNNHSDMPGVVMAPPLTQALTPVNRQPPNKAEAATNKSAIHGSTSTPSMSHGQKMTMEERPDDQGPLAAASTPSRPQHSGEMPGSTFLSAADALSLRRDGVEVTIQRLRQALEEATNRDTTAKAALAKSDAVILELRSSIRQLKRQMEKLAEEKAHAEQAQAQLEQHVRQLEEENHPVNSGGKDLPMTENNLQDKITMGELQVQLDRAHAQILTADMVRKELEDTLEAEQYTWELRVQDQERTIQQLTQECTTLSQELEQQRASWHQAEEGWQAQLHELQAQLDQVQQEARHWKSLQSSNQETTDLTEKILRLEQERKELQNCLDEALKELEAVDAELQNDNSAELRAENERLQRLLKDKDSGGGGSSSALLEPLQHLYRWLLERDGMDDSVGHAAPREAREVIAALQSHLEKYPPQDMDLAQARQQVAELESQLSVYRGDLKAREDSSAELRASLKEAVALLKPLQDAVNKADKEKAALQQSIESLKKNGGKNDDFQKIKNELSLKEKEIDLLKQEIESLELQLTKAKMIAANNVVAAHNNGSSKDIDVSTSVSKARQELKAKRDAEQTLKQLLRDAQARFSTLHQQNQEVQAMNNELQGRLRSAEDILVEKPSNETEEIDRLQQMLTDREAQISDLKSQLEEFAESSRFQASSKARDAENRVKELEAKLSSTMTELNAKREVEKALNSSLKEALGLLKPLQIHLEEAEREKQELQKELRSLKHRHGEDPSFISRSLATSVDDADTIRELQETVRQLERENSQLHDALEDVSQSFNASHLSGGTGLSQKNEAKLREEIVELKSRYEVTRGRLEDAFAENQSLAEALRNKRAKGEGDSSNQFEALREQLRRSEAELETAKFIATSALVKVEELTMANIEQLSMNNKGLDRDQLYKEKAKEFDQEMKAAKSHRVQYRLT